MAPTRCSLAGRAAAIALVVALSGVARAVPPRPIGPHRCQCQAHGADHVCACRICNEALRRARLAAARKADAAVPPCHRAAAAKAREADAERERRRIGRPSLLPTCGLPEPGDPVTPGGDAFTVPRAPTVARVEWTALVLVLECSEPDRSAAPELPPPRA
jgi:hypothetical protein